MSLFKKFVAGTNPVSFDISFVGTNMLVNRWRNLLFCIFMTEKENYDPQYQFHITSLPLIRFWIPLPQTST